MLKVMRLPKQLRLRRSNTHKGDYGHILVIAGSKMYSGAAVLCAEAAMRSGAGLVTLAIPESLNSSIIKIKLKEIMTFPLLETKEGTISIKALGKIIEFIKKNIDVVIVGPGLSQNKDTQSFIKKLILRIEKPLVIDADGLNSLVDNLDVLRKKSILKHPIVITPHPGEMARLLKKSISEIEENRKVVAKNIATTYNITVVLKGSNTVVVDTKNYYINKSGNPGMATAGSGDVLAGIIGSFIGQKLNLFDAAKFAVWIHGVAGDLAAKEKTQLSLIASDIINKLPEAIKKSI